MLIRQATENIEGLDLEIVDFSGLLADYVRENDIACIVRGLRDRPRFHVGDAEGIYTNEYLYEGFETMFLLTDINHSYVSSSAIKEILYFDGNVDGACT